MSQYIANLNRLSPSQDSLADPTPGDDDFSAFLNADFFDINSGLNPSVDFASPIDLDIDGDSEANPQPNIGEKLPSPTENNNMDPNMDFNLSGMCP